jgi:hypothetical protein
MREIRGYGPIRTRDERERRLKAAFDLRERIGRKDPPPPPPPPPLACFRPVPLARLGSALRSRGVEALLPTAREIIATVGRRHGFSPEAITGCGRNRCLTAARFEAVWLVWSIRQLSTVQVGRIMNRDHSTIICAARRFLEMTGLPHPTEVERSVALDVLKNGAPTP